VQSYPVFALPLAAFIQWAQQKKWRTMFYLLGLYLVAVNILQVWQYNHTILHYNDMNRQYYGRIYLNPNPTPLDMSLLDTADWLTNEKVYRKHIMSTVAAKDIHVGAGAKELVTETALFDSKIEWLKIESGIKVSSGLWGSYLLAEMTNGEVTKHENIRLFRPMAQEGKMSTYAFYMQRPANFKNTTLKIFLTSDYGLNARVEGLIITGFKK
jgi:hypothetical protein